MGGGLTGVLDKGACTLVRVGWSPALPTWQQLPWGRSCRGGALPPAWGSKLTCIRALLLRALPAAANGAEFVEMFQGVAAARIRSLFKTARKNAPAIIFIGAPPRRRGFSPAAPGRAAKGASCVAPLACALVLQAARLPCQLSPKRSPTG